MKLPKCHSDKERRRIEDCELAAINAIPLASINIPVCAQTTAQQSVGGDHTETPLVHTTLAKAETRAVLRVWGARPFHPASDNSARAQSYWSEVAALELKRQIKVNLNSPTCHEAVLAEIRQLHPGAGPGVPPHMPLSYDTVPDQIVSISCGKTFFAALTILGEVYIVGHALHGELGLGPKVGALRVPRKVTIEEGSVRADSQSALSSSSHQQSDEVIDDTPNLTDDKSEEPEIASPLIVADSARIKTISAGASHCLALSDKGELFVWGRANACGLMTVENILWPTSMRCFSPALANRKILAVAAQGTKTAAISGDGVLLLWGCWPGSAPILKPTEVARVNSDEVSISDAQIALGDTMGILHLKFAHHPTKSYLYQFGVGVRNEILAVDHSADDSEVPIFNRICEERYNVYVPEIITCYLNDRVGVGCNDILDIAVGHRHVLVLTSDNRLVAWGDNTWGQCGIAGEYKTHVSEPTMVELKCDMIPRQVFAGGNQSAIIGDNGSIYVWGCTRDHRLANSGIKLLAEAPMRALNDSKPGAASLSRTSTIGTSTQVSIKDSVFQPERLLALASLTCTAIGMGDNYTVIATGGEKVQ